MLAEKKDRRMERELAPVLRKEISKPVNRHQLSRFSAFRPVEDLPEHLRTLLARLDQCETASER